ncbi:helix-turn-helix domain-containing protein [Clostridium sp. C105KSO13]|uniref:helix-turn-helix domain-containing protein n=1 Tax=Clostridium sp. C105KSO13 TaxID=1776045 RepID=UPI0007406E69|nr:helix-turn-helix transcriptional regulator [Clostridium sp. C105KSO13]CUX32151.1 hypothetical protein BN3456_01375 [Clostridium sp. C105KSO13]
MEDLTFGEQVKIILGRRGMTIKELAETMEKCTGQKMSRQNLTQRLGRDNFQEQDMRKIAEILGCPFHLSILSGDAPAARTAETAAAARSAKEPDARKMEERDMTIGELYKIHEGLSQLEENVQEGKQIENIKEELEKTEAGESDIQEDESPGVEPDDLDQDDFEPVIRHDDVEEDRELGDMNPYTGREYQTNSVRMHPTRIGYVQVYDRAGHKWTDMTEWAFLGYQERKKALLGKEYEPPIYLD